RATLLLARILFVNEDGMKPSAESPGFSSVSTAPPVLHLVESGRLTAGGTDKEASSVSLVRAPDDTELYWYLGRQRRWVQVLMIPSFLLAGFSLFRFSLTTPWLWPLLLVLTVNLLGALISMFSGLNPRKISRGSHEGLVRSW